MPDSAADNNINDCSNNNNNVNTQTCEQQIKGPTTTSKFHSPKTFKMLFQDKLKKLQNHDSGFISIESVSAAQEQQQSNDVDGKQLSVLESSHHPAANIPKPPSTPTTKWKWSYFTKRGSQSSIGSSSTVPTTKDSPTIPSIRVDDSALPSPAPYYSSSLPSVSVGDKRLDAVGVIEEELEDYCANGMQDLSLNKSEQAASESNLPHHNKRWAWLQNNSNNFRRSKDTESQSNQSTPGSKRQGFFGQTFKFGKQLSLSAPKLNLTSAPKQPWSHFKIAGELPAVELNKISKNDKQTDEEYKRQRQLDIVSILRGKAELPEEMAAKYKISCLLGDGAFGYVFAAKDLLSREQEEVAIKFIDKASVPKRSWVNDDQYGYIPFEAHFLINISHPNIIGFRDLYSDAKYVYLVTDLHGTEWRSDNLKLSQMRNPGLRANHGVLTQVKRQLLATSDFSRLKDEELMQRKRTACDLFECIDAQ